MSLTALRQADWLDRPRVERIAVAFAVVALLATAWHVVQHTTHGVTDAVGMHLGHDFINYWSGARLGAEGRAATAYDTAAFHAYQRAFAGEASTFRMYSYPPTAMLLTLPLATLGFIPGLVAWSLGGIAATALLLRRLLGTKLALLAAAAAPAAYLNTISGQNGQLSAVLLAGGLMLLERRPVLAGLVLGGLCYKPQLALLLPFALAAAGQWRAFVATGLSALALSAASLALFGPEAWAGFLQQSELQRKLMEAGHSFWHRMPTPFAMLRMLGAGLPLAYAAQILSALGAIGATVLAWRSPATQEVKAAVLVLATFLATPYAWDYDLIACVFAVAWIAGAAARDGFRPWEKIALALLVAMPVLIGPLAKATALQIGPLVLWLALALALRRALVPATVSPSLPASSPGLSAASR